MDVGLARVEGQGGGKAQVADLNPAASGSAEHEGRRSRRAATLNQEKGVARCEGTSGWRESRAVEAHDEGRHRGARVESKGPAVACLAERQLTNRRCDEARDSTRMLQRRRREFDRDLTRRLPHEREPEGRMVGGEERIGWRCDRIRCRWVDDVDRPVPGQRFIGILAGRWRRRNEGTVLDVPCQTDLVGDKGQEREETFTCEPGIAGGRHTVRQIGGRERFAGSREQITDCGELECVEDARITARGGAVDDRRVRRCRFGRLDEREQTRDPEEDGISAPQQARQQQGRDLFREPRHGNAERWIGCEGSQVGPELLGLLPLLEERRQTVPAFELLFSER